MATESWTPPVGEPQRAFQTEDDVGLAWNQVLCAPAGNPGPPSSCPDLRPFFSPAPGTRSGPIPSTEHTPFSDFYLSQRAFWPLILIPVNMIHEGPGLGSATGLLESPIKEPSIIYENYRGAPTGKGWAASRWRAVCQLWPPSVPASTATGGFAAGGGGLWSSIQL